MHVPGHEAWKREHATHVLPEEEARHLGFLVLMDCDNCLHQNTHNLVGELIQHDGQQPSCNWHMPTGGQTTVMHLSYKLQGKQHDTTHIYIPTSVILSSNKYQDVLEMQSFDFIWYMPGQSAYLHVDCCGRGVRQQQHHEEERVRSGKDMQPMCQDYHSSPCRHFRKD